MTKDTYKQQAKTARVIARQITTNEHDRKVVTSQLMTTILIFGGKIKGFKRGES